MLADDKDYFVMRWASALRRKKERISTCVSQKSRKEVSYTDCYIRISSRQVISDAVKCRERLHLTVRETLATFRSNAHAQRAVQNIPTIDSDRALIIS